MGHMMIRAGIHTWRCPVHECAWEMTTTAWDRTDTAVADAHLRWHTRRARLWDLVRRWLGTTLAGAILIAGAFPALLALAEAMAQAGVTG